MIDPLEDDHLALKIGEAVFLACAVFEGEGGGWLANFRLGKCGGCDEKGGEEDGFHDADNVCRIGGCASGR
jgi:hypothetical protein